MQWYVSQNGKEESCASRIEVRQRLENFVRKVAGEVATPIDEMNLMTLEDSVQYYIRNGGPDREFSFTIKMESWKNSVKIRAYRR